MKTVKDVYAQYKEWPSDDVNHAIICRNGDIIFDYYEIGSFNSDRFCTREQYEQYKDEQESKDNSKWLVNAINKATNDAIKRLADKARGESMKADWYDYDKGEAVRLPPVGVECETFHYKDWVKTYIIGVDLHGYVVYDCSEFDDEKSYDGDKSESVFRPLDHDKYKDKVAPREWMIDIGVLCDFSDDNEMVFIGKLTSVADNGPFMYTDENKRVWKYCRPRMNHKHVLDGAQLNIIPNCFIIETYATKRGEYIVEFTGLKDGYVWEGE